MANIETTAFAKFNFAEGAAPGTPSAATTVLYVKSDGKVYAKDDAGTEYDLTAGSALGAWTAYTPTWTATTTNPTLGSTTITGRYKEIDGTTLAVSIAISITTGGAWNAGSGSYSFSLPATYTSGGQIQIIAGHVLDNGTAHYAAVGKINASGTTITEVIVADSTGNRLLANNAPVTWATGDQINLSGIIETT